MSDNIYGHNFHCPKRATHLTSLFLCGECGIRYDEWFASWQENQRLRELLNQQLAEKDNEIEDLILQANIRIEYLETKLAEKDTENQRLRDLLIEIYETDGVGMTGYMIDKVEKELGDDYFADSGGMEDE